MDRPRYRLRSNVIETNCRMCSVPTPLATTASFAGDGPVSAHSSTGPAISLNASSTGSSNVVESQRATTSSRPTTSHSFSLRQIGSGSALMRPRSGCLTCLRRPDSFEACERSCQINQKRRGSKSHAHGVNPTGHTKADCHCGASVISLTDRKTILRYQTRVRRWLA